MALSSIPHVNAKPVEVAQGSADDLGVMSISLKDVVKPQVGVQAQTQAAGTPNEAGIGGFLPLVVGKNSVFFADVLANATPAVVAQGSAGDLGVMSISLKVISIDVVLSSSR